jgi:cell division protein FtsB
MKRIGWVIFALLVIYFIFLIRQDIIDNLALRKEVQALAKKVEIEEKSETELKQRLARLNGDQLIEELARTRLGMVKKGETAYKVISK